MEKSLDELTQGAIFVDMDVTPTLKKAKKGEKIYTHGVSPCVAGAFYDPTRKEAYMFHTPDLGASDLERYVREIRKGDFDPKKTEVWITGYGPHEGSTQAELLSKRASLATVLEGNFPVPNITYRWLNAKDQSATLFVDTSSGEVIIDIERFTDAVYDPFEDVDKI